MGWLFDRAGQAEHARYARDLYEDRGMQVINRTFGLWVLAGLALPFGLGYLIDGTVAGALTAALVGGRPDRVADRRDEARAAGVERRPSASAPS